MNEIIKSVLKSEFPKMEVEIGIFEHRTTSEIKFCVMSVNTGICGWQDSYMYNATEWRKLDSKLLEGVSRIQESFYNSLLRKMEE